MYPNVLHSPLVFGQCNAVWWYYSPGSCDSLLTAGSATSSSNQVTLLLHSQLDGRTLNRCHFGYGDAEGQASDHIHATRTAVIPVIIYSFIALLSVSSSSLLLYLTQAGNHGTTRVHQCLAMGFSFEISSENHFCTRPSSGSAEEQNHFKGRTADSRRNRRRRLSIAAR